MEKKAYDTPVMQVLVLGCCDVLTNSNDTDFIPFEDSGDGEFMD